MQPVSRAEMQARRAAKIEADRQHFIKQTIETIYKSALHIADTQETTSYKYLVNSTRGDRSAKTLAGQAIISKFQIEQPNPQAHAILYHSQQDINKHVTMLFDNANDITEQLRLLFPDCTVKYMSQVQDTKGIWHEESTITEALKPFITTNCQEVILIDWSDQIPS